MTLVFAIIFIMLAFICYTVGVWSERTAGRLIFRHMIFFWAGFAFDITGTALMSLISGDFQADIHGITGVLAIILMAFHTIWASFVLAHKKEKSITTFHKFSLLVWCIWLIPFITGMVINM